ncbi:hypothetical protein B0H13DRAFT_1870459 [Mycena leptocephala]|nr:hypothetical protein B0H13DRAFT_1870459 [Mycena leptocephala]
MLLASVNPGEQQFKLAKLVVCIAICTWPALHSILQTIPQSIEYQMKNPKKLCSPCVKPDKRCGSIDWVNETSITFYRFTGSLMQGEDRMEGCPGTKCNCSFVVLAGSESEEIIEVKHDIGFQPVGNIALDEARIGRKTWDRSKRLPLIPMRF